MAQSDTVLVVRNGFVIKGKDSVAVEQFIRQIDTIQDASVRIRKKEELLMMMKSK